MQSHTIKSYTDADEILTGRCKDRRKITNNTWLERRGPDEIAVRLHATDVVTYYADGSIRLNTGGWFTVTTKARINEFSPFSVSSNRGEWNVSIRNPNYVDHFTGDYRDNPYWADSRPFRDGMIWLDGKWYGVPSDEELAADRAARKKLYADIKKFVDGITPERIIHAWENPGGDCLLCRFPPGTGGDDHLLAHIEEDYFHAHLALRAVEARGFNTDFAMSFIYSSAQRGEVDKHFLKDSLTKFLRKQLTQGVAVKA